MMTQFKNLFKLFLVWRLFLFIPVIVGSAYLDYGTSYPFFEVNHYQIVPDYLNYPVLKTWANFDGVHYLNIATNGYISGARFFPLFPSVIWLSGFGIGSFSMNLIASLIIPNFIFIGTLFIFLKLLKLDYDKKESFQTVLYLLIFPTAFFFICVYGEGLFLLLTLLSFYSMRKKKWYLAAIFASLASATRLAGIAILPALIVEYWITEKPKSLKSWLILFSISAISPLGLVVYSFYNYLHWGNFLYFINAQGELNNGRSTSSFVFPLQTMYRYLKILVSLPINLFEWWVALLELLSFVFAGLLLIIAWIKRIRISYLIYGVLAFLLPVLTGTFSGLPRYVIVIFPIFIAMALIKTKFFKIFYYLISTVLLFLLLMFFAKAYYIA